MAPIALQLYIICVSTPILNLTLTFAPPLPHTTHPGRLHNSTCTCLLAPSPWGRRAHRRGSSGDGEALMSPGPMARTCCGGLPIGARTGVRRGVVVPHRIRDEVRWGAARREQGRLGARLGPGCPFPLRSDSCATHLSPPRRLPPPPS